MELQYQFYVYHGKYAIFENPNCGEISKRKNKKSTLITVFTVYIIWNARFKASKVACPMPGLGRFG